MKTKRFVLRLKMILHSEKSKIYFDFSIKLFNHKNETFRLINFIIFRMKIKMLYIEYNIR